MCSMFSQINPDAYTYQTRSVRLGGHATSIRLEASFWNTLEEIAAAEHVSLGRFLTKLHDEVLEFRGETQNFTSLLRCACLAHVSRLRGVEAAKAALMPGQTLEFPPAGNGLEKPRPAAFDRSAA
jgi:predicted DNA-binding ribbon-helix-helix protein